MTRPSKPPLGAREPPERLGEEEIRRLAEEAREEPEKRLALLRRVVLQTIAEVREELGKDGGPETSE